MNKLFNILVVSLSFLVLCWSYELHAADVSLASVQQRAEKVNLRNIEIVKDIRTFIQQHPHLRLIRLDKKTPHNRSQSVKYTLGTRVSGDRMVGQYADTFFYPAPKNVSHQVTHQDTSSVLTFLDIQCLQDNIDGNAYIVDGGIGQRFISIVLEATETERFSYNVHVYGKE